MHTKHSFYVDFFTNHQNHRIPWLIDRWTIPRTLWGIHRTLGQAKPWVWVSGVANATPGGSASRMLDLNSLQISLKINENQQKSSKINGNQWESIENSLFPLVFCEKVLPRRRLARPRRAALAGPDAQWHVPAPSQYYLRPIEQPREHQAIH